MVLKHFHDASQSLKTPDTFTRLRSLLQHHGFSSDPSATPSSVLAALGTPSASIAILRPAGKHSNITADDNDNKDGTITSDCISSIGDDTSTAFQAASISKPVAGMAAMKLVQQGKLQLDGTIADYLPANLVEILAGPFPTALTRELAGRITIKQLMSHTSGLSVHGFPGYEYCSDPASGGVPDAATILAGKAPANTTRVGVESFPGYAFSYSGGGLTVLQLIMEAITGKPFATLMRDLVLAPLGMTRSFYGRPEDSGEDNYAKAHWTGYTPCSPPYNVFPEQAAAGLWTTPTDLLRVVRAMQRSLRGEKGAFLPRDLARRMVEEVEGGMALTWKAPRVLGNMFGHTGSNGPGWFCVAVGYADVLGGEGGEEGEEMLEEGCGVCVMTNSAVGMAVFRKLVLAVQYLEGWAPTERFMNPGQVFSAFAIPSASVPEIWKDWEGRWGKEGQFELLEGQDAATGAVEESSSALQTNENADGGKARGPYLQFENLPQVKLGVAAMPRDPDAKEERLWFVVEGMTLMVCLTSRDGKEVLEIWSEGPASVDVLERYEVESS